jgi:glutamine cyclotransferase
MHTRGFRMPLLVLWCVLQGGLLSSCSTPADSVNSPGSPEGDTSAGPPTYTYKIIKAYPHDRRAFTQGLAFEDGVLYESTGLRGQSTLRKVDLTTGAILQSHRLPARFFGEGMTIFGNQIMQLTWQSRLGLVYDKQSFTLLQQFYYPMEGWGITHDGRRLILSDGTSTLYFLDPKTFTKLGQIKVSDPTGPVAHLNELEYVQGEIYANVWQTDRIARIAPDTGQVLGWIDLGGLLDRDHLREPVDVLNGIAYDAQGDRLFVTGKWWPRLFEIALVSVAE